MEERNDDRIIEEPEVQVVEETALDEQKRKKGKDNKTWGRNSLVDPTHSGVGEEIMKLTVEKPYGYRTRLAELYEQYNEKVGFLAFGTDSIE